MVENCGGLKPYNPIEKPDEKVVKKKHRKRSGNHA